MWVLGVPFWNCNFSHPSCFGNLSYIHTWRAWSDQHCGWRVHLFDFSLTLDYQNSSAAYFQDCQKTFWRLQIKRNHPIITGSYEHKLLTFFFISEPLHNDLNTNVSTRVLHIKCYATKKKIHVIDKKDCNCTKKEFQA